MFPLIRALFRRRPQTVRRLPPCRPSLERLEARTVPATLSYSVPDNTGMHHVVLAINAGAYEVFDNNSLVASQAVAATTAVLLNDGANNDSTFDIENLAAGSPAEVDLGNGTDTV